MHTMELAAASTQAGACADLAEELNAQLYVDERGATGLPFTALLTGVTDSVTDFQTVADVGLYLICRRLIKPGVPQKIAETGGQLEIREVVDVLGFGFGVNFDSEEVVG